MDRVTRQRSARASTPGALARPRGNRGLATLELAATLPLMLLFLYGVFEFGLAFARQQVVTGAAREGARQAILFRTDCDPAVVASDVRAVVGSTASVLGIDPTDLVVTLEGACQPGLTAVTVLFVHHVELLSNLTASVPSSLTLKGRALMRNEIIQN